MKNENSLAHKVQVIGLFPGFLGHSPYWRYPLLGPAHLFMPFCQSLWSPSADLSHHLRTPRTQNTVSPLQGSWAIY